MDKINKRGSDLAFPIVIFLVLNILFFSMMMVFVQRVSSNALIYEEAYSKKIGLLLNRAEPGMEFTINITELAKVALKNGIEIKNIEEIIRIDTDKGIVFIKAKPEGGFNFPYFSYVNIEKNSPTIKLRNDEIEEALYLIKIK